MATARQDLMRFCAAEGVVGERAERFVDKLLVANAIIQSLPPSDDRAERQLTLFVRLMLA